MRRWSSSGTCVHYNTNAHPRTFPPGSYSEGLARGSLDLVRGRMVRISEWELCGFTYFTDLGMGNSKGKANETWQVKIYTNRTWLVYVCIVLIYGEVETPPIVKYNYS